MIRLFWTSVLQPAVSLIVHLQNGAEHCYALDVGYNQLAWKIRQDPRVTVMERTNFRHATARGYLQKVVLNLQQLMYRSFHLALILPPLKKIIADGGDVIALVKPQFEAGKGKVGKKGVVRERIRSFGSTEKNCGMSL